MNKVNSILLCLFLSISMSLFSQDTLLLQQKAKIDRYFAKNINLDSLFIFANGEIKNVPSNMDSITMSMDIKTGKIVDPYFYKAKTFIVIFDSQKADTLWMWGRYKTNSYFLIYIPVPKYLIENNGTDKMYVNFIRYRSTLRIFFSRKKSFGVTYGLNIGTFYITKGTKLGEDRGNVYPIKGKNKGNIIKSKTSN